MERTRSKMTLFTCFHLTLIVFVGIPVLTSGQKLRGSSCPTLSSSASPTLTIENLADTWKVLAWSPSIHRYDWRCVTYTFTTITENLKYSVAIAGTQKYGGSTRATGMVTITGNNGADSATGTYLTFEVTQGDKVAKWNYYIAKTDNTNYIVLYACENFLLGRLESAIVLALADTTDAKITEALNSLAPFGVSRSDLAYPFTVECL